MLQKFAMLSFAETMLSCQIEAAHIVSKSFCDVSG